MRFASRVKQLAPSASIAMGQRKLSGSSRKIIDLTWGQPDFDTPEHIKKAACEAIGSGLNGYTPSSGIPQLRSAISDFYSSLYRVSYDPGTEILVTPGAKQGLMYLVQALIDPGDEVILFEPCWLSYRDMILLNEGTPVFLPAKEDLAPDIARLEEFISSKTKAIMINNPVNPSGYVFTKEELRSIGKLAEKHDLYIISDEIYDRIVFTEFTSMCEFEDFRNRLIVANGFSKTYAMTGWRIGYLLGNEDIISKVSLIHQHTATCAAAASQYAALAALRHNQDQVEHMVKTYRERRDFMIEGLKNTPFNIISPDGAFYAMLDVSDLCSNEKQNAEEMLDKFGIAAINGISYGKSAGNYVRLSLTADIKILSEVIDRLNS